MIAVKFVNYFLPKYEASFLRHVQKNSSIARLSLTRQITSQYSLRAKTITHTSGKKLTQNNTNIPQKNQHSSRNLQEEWKTLFIAIIKTQQ